jgi:superkiller protein 3
LVKRISLCKTCRLACLICVFAGLISGLVPVLANSHYRPETIPHLQAGAKLLHDRQLAAAIDEFTTVVKMEPNLPDAYNELGLAYTYQSNSAKAQQYFRKALDLEPLYVPALNNLGLVLYNSGKPADALHYWQRCLEVSNTKEPDLYYYIANALRDTGKKVEARENYVTAIKLKPENAAAYSGLAALDLAEGRLDEALREVNKAIKLRPDSAFSYFHLGVIDEKLGDAAGALAAYQNSLRYETVPKYANQTKDRIARLRGAGAGGGSSDVGSNEIKARAQTALARHEWAEAARDLEGLTRGASANDPIVWNNLGLALAGESLNSKAVDAYRKALQLRSDGFAEAQYNLGMVLRHMGDNAGAIDAFQKAISDAAKQKKTNPLAQNMLGIIKRERGDFEGADRAFKMAIAQSSDSLPVAHYNRALLLEHNENTRDAINEYKTYLMHAPNGKNAPAAKTRLKRLTGA